jgi:hypothetical protein
MKMGLGSVLDEIGALPHFRTLVCATCGSEARYHVLQFYAICPECQQQHKVRAFGGIGTEIQDVIDAVLAWAGEGETYEAVLARYREIQNDQSK